MHDSNNNTITDEFIELVQRVLNGEASLDDLASLNTILPQNPEALSYFVKMRMLHATLTDHLDSPKPKIATLGQAIRNSESQPIHRFEPKKASPKKLKRGLFAAAAILLLSLIGAFVFHQFDQHKHQNAYQIVAVTSEPDPSLPTRGEWLQTNRSYKISSGVLEMHSPDGNELTIQAPAEFSIDSKHALTLTKGKLWAVLDGPELDIHTPQGLVQDLGTTFGVDQSSANTTRVDVVDGEVQITNAKQQSKTASKGFALIADAKRWPPSIAPADASRYHTGLRTPIGITFAKNSVEAAEITNANPMATKWTAITTHTGQTIPNNASFEIRWVGSTFFSENSDQSVESKIFHTHIQGWPWTDKLITQADRLGFPTDQDLGIAIHLSGMKTWLKQIGASAYTIEVLRNSGVKDVNFLPVRASAEFGEAPIETLTAGPDNLLPANHPDQLISEKGNRASQTFKTPFSLDTLTITTPSQAHAIHQERANISAIRIIPIFEK